MSVLRSQDLLLIAPHFEAFIRDQATIIMPYLNTLTVLMPMPYFSSIASNLPYIKKYFSFLNMALQSRYETAKNYTMISPEYFNLPIEVLKKRNCYLAARSCIKALSKNTTKFSFIHAHFLEMGFVGAKLKKLYDKPFVVTGHGRDIYDLPFRNNWYSALARYVLGEADQVITVSQSNAEKISLFGVSSEKVHVIPNGYDEKLFKPTSLLEARKNLGIPINKKVLLSVGNLVDVKGHTYLIDAMRIVCRKRNDVILVIVGSGLLKEHLQNKIKRLMLNEKILLVGYKRHEEIPLWMNACDLFILPSLRESFGVVQIEAMACGKPVVATRNGGSEEIVVSEDYGFLCKPASPKELAEKILIGLNNEWDTEKILNYAMRFTWWNSAREIRRIYKLLF